MSYGCVECPYCGEENDVTGHDPAGEGEYVETDCHKCEKNFIFYSSYSVDYTALKADCLNGGEHDWKPMSGAPKEFFEGKFYCGMCNAKKHDEVRS